MENVSGMVKGKMRIIFSEIMRELKTSGYEVSAKLLNAMWFGVPQSRPRVIFVGARNDLGIKFPESGSHPRPETIPIAASGAIPGIMTTRSQDINRRIGSDRPSATICRTASGYGSLFVQSHPSAETRPVTVADALPWIKMGKFGKAWKDADRTSPAISRSLAYNPETSSQGLEMVEAERVIHDTSGQYSERDVPNRPSPAIVRGCESLFIEREADISGTAIAREWDKLRPGQASKKYFNLVRPDPDKPCPTVTEKGAQNRSIASVTYPTERRKLSIAELKRLGAFPDGFEFEGTYAEQWGQIGNSVPPLFMRAIAAHVRREILDRAPRP
jgi:DNA (cytosine-5)-methyltransferase 1